MKINLHIERLVLDGLPISRRDGPAIETAVRSELSRLLGSGQFTSSQAVASAKVPAITLNSTTPSAIGQQIATSIYGGVKQ
jgi:hypothetical protein